MHKLFCKAANCLKSVPNERSIMCEPHWAMVPESIKIEIWNAYEPAEVEQSAEYWHAVMKAVNAVTELLSAQEATV